MSTESNKKLGYLEGLRGICCMIVIIDHCVNAYYPSLQFTNESGVSGEIKRVIAQSPLNIIYSGLTPVYIFFILSGFVLSQKYFLTNNVEFLVSGAIKRYFRLLGPVLFSLLLFWAVYHMLAFFNIANVEPFTIGRVLNSAFYNVFFVGSDIINGPLWTMKLELFGSFLVFTLLALTHGLHKKILLILVALAFSLVYEPFRTSYFLFLFGVLSCYFSTNSIKGGRNVLNVQSKCILFMMLIVSLIFISFPAPRDNVDIGLWYRVIAFQEIGNLWQIHNLWHVLGAALFFVVTFNSNILKFFFSSRICTFLGGVSFPAYLIHYLIITILLFVSIDVESQFVAFIIKTTMVFAITILLSIPYEKYIDKPSLALSAIIYNVFKRPKLGNVTG